MKKNGFILVETLIATTLIAVVFTIIYIEFGTISENYKNTYNNNTVDKIYAVNNIRNFILSNGYNNISSSNTYLDITSCSYFTSETQCVNLINVLEIEKVLYLPGSFLSYKEDIMSDTNISDNLKKYLKSLNNEYNDLLIVEFKDKKCAMMGM